MASAHRLASTAGTYLPCENREGKWALLHSQWHLAFVFDMCLVGASVMILDLDKFSVEKHKCLTQGKFLKNAS